MWQSLLPVLHKRFCWYIIVHSRLEGLLAGSCEHGDKPSCSGAMELVSYLNISNSYSLCRNIKQFSYLNSPKSFPLAVFVLNLWKQTALWAQCAAAYGSFIFEATSACLSGRCAWIFRKNFRISKESICGPFVSKFPLLTPGVTSSQTARYCGTALLYARSTVGTQLTV
jgi:hypothetical protein